MASKGQWVFAPDSGGVKIPEAVKLRTTALIERFAAENYAGRYTRLEIRFRGQFCYIDAYTEPELPGDNWPLPIGRRRAKNIWSGSANSLHISVDCGISAMKRAGASRFTPTAMSVISSLYFPPVNFSVRQKKLFERRVATFP